MPFLFFLFWVLVKGVSLFLNKLLCIDLTFFFCELRDPYSVEDSNFKEFAELFFLVVGTGMEQVISYF